MSPCNFSRQISQRYSHFVSDLTHYGRRDLIGLAGSDIDSVWGAGLNLAAANILLTLRIRRLSGGRPTQVSVVPLCAHQLSDLVSPHKIRDGRINV